MLAYMNAESYAETLATGRAVYYSRSRNKLWRKGEESGNVQQVRAHLPRLRRRHDPAEGRPDRRRRLPRRLQELLLPPGHARGAEGRRPAGVRSRRKCTGRNSALAACTMRLRATALRAF